MSGSNADDFGAYTRRAVVAGLSSLAAVPSAFAATKSPIAYGALENNPLALAFESAPTRLPDLTIVGPDGEKPIKDLLLGRTVLMPIWAEWCAPCIAEMPDFARIQTKYGNDRFVVMPVLSATQHQLNPTSIAKLFQVWHAEIFTPHMEKNLGKRLAMAMGQRGNGYVLPCTILIRPDGRVAGRLLGLKNDETPEEKKEKTAASIIARAEAGDNLSYWGKEAGEALAAAMANGFLTDKP
jgi:thiol-disulfide isomerase/thioredoxin